MIVVFDTNIWKSSLYLRSPAAAAVRAYLKMKKARVALPEVVELEILRHLEADIRKIRNDVQTGHNKLLAFFGELKELVLPNDEEIKQLVENRLSMSGFDLVRIPFDEIAARLSFIRTIDKTPPSQGSQQFKDGVIWENCKVLARDSDVVFVTGDQAFFKDKKLESGLDIELAEELKSQNLSLRVVSGLSELLREIRQQVNLDNNKVSAAINHWIGKRIDEFAVRNGFIRDSGIFDAKFFATEQADSLYVEIQAKYSCHNIDNLNRKEGALDLRCNGKFDITQGDYSQLRATEMKITFSTDEAEEIQRNNQYIFVEPLTIGHRTVTHIIRQPLD